MPRERLFKFASVGLTGKELTCAVLQAAQMLTILNAELARILHIQCQDIGLLLDAKSEIKANSLQMDLAEEFICFYNLLYDYFRGDAVAMRHWLRADNKELQGTPLLIIIDEMRIADVISYLKSSADDYNRLG